MTPLTRTLSDIKWWWQRIHPPLNKLPNWRKGNEAERNALSRGCTQDIHRAREIKSVAVHRDMAASRPDLAARLFPDEGNVSRAKDRARLRESW